jgi:hypothetical protein
MYCQFNAAEDGANFDMRAVVGAIPWEILEKRDGAVQPFYNHSHLKTYFKAGLVASCARTVDLYTACICSSPFRATQAAER